jgi:diguanylate cyclase (GGDEF)-like protein
MSAVASRPLPRSIAASNLMAAAVALMFASLVLIAYQFVSMGRGLLESVQVQARIVGANTAAALVFDDQRAGSETLSALEAVASVRSAVVFKPSGQTLATYRRPGRQVPEPPDDALLRRGYEFSIDKLKVAQRIVHQGQSVGIVVIEAGLDGVYWRLLGYAALMLMVVAGSLGLTLPLITRMRHRVAEAELHLYRLAHVDPVTELPNRHAFNDHLRRAVERCTASGGRLALALLDLDNFKVVNDTFGHAHGDLLLKAIAQRLLTLVRGTDVVCRLGGDEFTLILLPLETPQQAQQFAERLLAKLKQPLTVDGREYHVTASVGLSCCPADGIDADTLMRNADTAMYHAKHLGKNGCALFEPALNQRAASRLALEADLHRAVDNQDFELQYQPQIGLADGRIIGIEALLRWPHASRSQVSTYDFVQGAEECGLIVPIGRWVLRTACRQAAEWSAAGLLVPPLSVNVSVRQLRDPHFCDDIDAALRDSGLAAHKLGLEITESLLLDTDDASIGLLTRLRAKGIRLSIDDFGTGHSSLSYLPRLPVHAIKIDRSFIERIPGDGASITIAILAMAKSFGLSVVAEGAEQEEQVQFLRQHGCTSVQGWYFAPAMPAEELASLLASNSLPFERRLRPAVPV